MRGHQNPRPMVEQLLILWWNSQERSSKSISARLQKPPEASKKTVCHFFCRKNVKDIMHKMNSPQKKSKSERQLRTMFSKRWVPNDGHFLGFWVLTDTSPQRTIKWLPCWKETIQLSLLLLLFLLLMLVLQLLLLLLSTASVQELAHFMSTFTQVLRNDGGTQRKPMKMFSASETSLNETGRFSGPVAPEGWSLQRSTFVGRSEIS